MSTSNGQVAFFSVCPLSYEVQIGAGLLILAVLVFHVLSVHILGRFRAEQRTICDPVTFSSETGLFVMFHFHLRCQRSQINALYYFVQISFLLMQRYVLMHA